MASTARPQRRPQKYTETASELVGAIEAAGFANLEVGSNGSKPARPGGVRMASSESSSSTLTNEEDFDDLKPDPNTTIKGSKGGGLEADATLQFARRSTTELDALDNDDLPKGGKMALLRRRTSIPVRLEKTNTKGKYLLSADDPEILEILRRGAQRELEGGKKRRSRFSDLVFTRQFTAFDRQNPLAYDSPFHGFFTLFWMGTFLMLLKVAASNWKQYGSVFGRNEIVEMMLSRDVVVLGLTDGVMCASTGFCLLLQLVIYKEWLSWSGSGWIIQNVWQTFYLGAVIGWTLYREWTWSHTVFIVLHCLVMLMKQHSYAFYNGHLSECYKRRKMVGRILKQLEHLKPNKQSFNAQSDAGALASTYFESQDVDNLQLRRTHPRNLSKEQVEEENSDIADVTAAIQSGSELTGAQLSSFNRILKWEIQALDEELKGKCSDKMNIYPRNLNFSDFYGYIPLPTVVYELEYPRQESVDWWYVAEKAAATFGVIIVMIVVSQAYIYPTVLTTVRMKEMGMTLPERLKEFPWILSDLVFPFMMEYLMAWYVIWECILNLLAELTRFADRGFYSDWWNCVSWDQFARDWNRPVHNFLLRHVYHSSISAFRLSRGSATLATFLLSACVHELVMWCIFKKLRGYLLIMQMLQLPLVGLSRSHWMKERKVLGNVVFWIGICTGPSLLCSLYLVI